LVKYEEGNIRANGGGQVVFGKIGEKGLDLMGDLC